MAGFNLDQVLANNRYYLGPVGTPVPRTTTGPFGLAQRPQAMTVAPQVQSAPSRSASTSSGGLTPKGAGPSGLASPASSPYGSQRFDAGNFKLQLQGANQPSAAAPPPTMQQKQGADLSRFKGILGGTGSDGYA